MFSIGVLFFVSVLALVTLSHRVIKCYIFFKSKAYVIPVCEPSSVGLHKVAIHLAIRNEEPSVVLRTLKALMLQYYQNYLIIVVDNNTADPNLWKPIEAFCRNSEILHFHHVDSLAGYKSGALNYALQCTPEDCEFISVIDCDTLVNPNYLSDLIPFFDDDSIDVVQSPSGVQDNFVHNSFTKAIGLIHRYFHSVYMAYSHLNKSVPFIGNMGIIRKSTLMNSEGWNGYYLAEDMELSRRLILGKGGSVFIDIPFGKTMLPLDLKDAKQQFFRWSFGNAQIFRDSFVRDLFDKKNTFFKLFTYYVLPGIHINVYTLPFYVLTIILLVLNIFGYSNPLLDLSSFIIFLTILLENIGHWITFILLTKKEGGGFQTALAAFVTQFGLSVSFSLGSYAVLVRKSMEFKITSHFKTNLSGNKYFRNGMNKFMADIMFFLIGLVLLILSFVFGSINIILYCNALTILLGSIIQIHSGVFRK